MARTRIAKTQNAYVYEFPAIRGIQGEREYYACMVPIPLLCKIFLFNEEELPIEVRFQRKLNVSRANALGDYVLENPKQYVLPALTASIDGDIEFMPIEAQGTKSDIGVLRTAMSARYLLNDGQHRKEGLTRAFATHPELAYETITVVFFLDTGLKRSQQIFADIHTNAVRPDKNLTLAFDHRDVWAVLTREVIKSVPFLRQFVQNEGGSIQKTSGKLFLRKWINEAHKRLCVSLSHSERERYCIGFWNALVEAIPQWRQLVEAKLAAYDVRLEYVSGCAIAITALSQVGADLVLSSRYVEHPDKLIDALAPLGDIDWHRSNPEWKGLVIDTVTGKILTQKVYVDAFVAYLNHTIRNRGIV